MKNLLRCTLALSFLALLITSCKKEETQVVFTGGTAPALTASATSGSVLPLDYTNRTGTIVQLFWTNPNYQFNSGVSSQNVTYTLQVDTVGSNFSNPLKKEVAITNQLFVNVIDSALNEWLLNQLLLKKNMAHNIEMRIKASLSGGAGELYSNSMRFSVTPYSIPPKVIPWGTAAINWVDGTLYITGGATPGNWMSGGDPPLNSQKFSMVDPTDGTKWVLNSIHLNGGAEYLLVPVYGNWNNKYGFTGNTADMNPALDDFKKEGNNFKAPAASGNYKIVVDYQIGKISVTPA